MLNYVDYLLHFTHIGNQTRAQILNTKLNVQWKLFTSMFWGTCWFSRQTGNTGFIQIWTIQHHHTNFCLHKVGEPIAEVGLLANGQALIFRTKLYISKICVSGIARIFFNTHFPSILKWHTYPGYFSSTVNCPQSFFGLIVLQGINTIWYHGQFIRK